MSRTGTLGSRLYSGQSSYDFIGKRRRWYAVSGLLMLVSVGALVLNGLNFGVEFTGGTVFQVQAPADSVGQAREAMGRAGVTESTITQTDNGRLRIQTAELDREEREAVAQELADTFDVDVEDVDVQFVGPSWGAEITQKAVYGLIAFLVLVTIFLVVYFELKMAIAAIVALIHDVVLTLGVYALFGLDVTPATIVGVLTILAFSLYDTVVVFDKVRENTVGIAGSSRRTYSEAANLSVNQTLVRSLNTSITTVIPVLAILVGAVWILGARTLTELAVALFVGTLAGTYSSLFIATPVLVEMKEREPQMQALAKRVEQRRAGLNRKSGGGATAEGAGTTTATVERTAAGEQVRKQPKRTKRSGKRR